MNAALKREPAPDWRDDARQYLLEIFRPGDGPQVQAQRALAEWLEEILRPDLFVTLRFNESLKPLAARQRLRVFGTMVEREWLGQNFSKKPHRERSLYAAFLEGIEQPHWHMLWRLPPAVQKTPLWKFQAILPAIAKRKIAPFGSLDVQDLRPNDGDLLRVATYCVKEFSGQHDTERFVISTEFRSVKRGEN